MAVVSAGVGFEMEFYYSVGGDKAKSAIAEAVLRYGTGPKLKVGFLENATYPDGTPVAMVAMINEFGATIQRDAGQITLYRMVNKSGTGFLRKGRFVSKSKANFASTHDHAAYEIKIPPRPFFRTMIANNQASWGPTAAKLLKQGIQPAEVLNLMGEEIAGQLRASIIALKTPPNAPSTIRKKGFDDPLIDTGHMLNSVDFEVTS